MIWLYLDVISRPHGLCVAHGEPVHAFKPPPRGLQTPMRQKGKGWAHLLLFRRYLCLKLSIKAYICDFFFCFSSISFTGRDLMFKYKYSIWKM